MAFENEQAIQAAKLSSEVLLGLIFHQIRQLNTALSVSPDTFLTLNYPIKGGRRAMPPGRTVFDFKEGTVLRPDATTEHLTASLKSIGLDEARSGFLWFDSDVDVVVKLSGANRGQFLIEQCNLIHLQFMPMDSIDVISANFPYNMYTLFSTANQVPKLVNGIVGHQERWGEITTVDAFTDILFGPTEGGELESKYRRANIPVGNLGAKVFLVHNTGSNDADINLQLIHNINKRWVNAIPTGASLTIPSGDNARIETGTPCGLVRLRARSSTAGSHTTLEAQYRGFSGVR